MPDFRDPVLFVRREERKENVHDEEGVHQALKCDLSGVCLVVESHSERHENPSVNEEEGDPKIPTLLPFNLWQDYEAGVLRAMYFFHFQLTSGIKAALHLDFLLDVFQL